ncbi:hypothetical protein ABPG75_005324 [Micractinium tetrahymenae]
MAFPGAGLDLPLDLFGMSSMDAPDELVPVDQFFGSYVLELNSRSKRSHEPGTDAAAGGKSVKLAAGQTAGMCGMGGPPLPQPQAGLAGAMQPPYLPAGQMAGVQSQQGDGMMCLPGGLPGMPMPAPQLNGGMQGLPGMMPAAGGINGMPAGGLPGGGQLPALGMMGLPGGLPAGYSNGGGMPGMGLPAGLDLSLDASGGLAGARPNMSGSLRPSTSAGEGSGGEGGSAAAGGKQRKTLKQQEANKIAQQRYRERKKQKFHEMEATIEQLTKQLQSLQALQSRNQILEGLNGELQCQLMSKEREVERLKVALDVAAERSLGSAPSSPSANGGFAEAAPLECADDGCVDCAVLPRDMAGIDFQKGFSDQVARLQEFVQQHGLEDCELAPAEAGMSKELRSELAQLVGRSCQLCQAALRAEGVKVMELISKDPNSFSTVSSEEEQRRWQACLDAMQLAPQQQENLLLSRRSHLQHMRAIYQERHNLNMQAMALMLPHSSRNPAEDNTVEGRLANMSQAGYLPVAKSSAELSDVLDKIKDNLRREQRAVMDLNCLLMSKILTPLQGARYMLGAYPQHCDALALSNVLAKSLGREAVSDGAPGMNGAAQASSGGGRGHAAH